MASSLDEFVYFHGPWRDVERRAVLLAMEDFEARQEVGLPHRHLGETWVFVKQPFVRNAFLYSAHRAGWMHPEGGRTAGELAHKLWEHPG